MGGGKGQATLNRQQQTTAYGKKRIEEEEQGASTLMEQPPTELEEEIERLENLGATLTEEEKELLRSKAPQGPKFQSLSKEQLAAKKKSERSAYKKAQKANVKWQTAHGDEWRKTKESVEGAVKRRVAIAQLTKKSNDLGAALPTVEATADAMDQALFDNTEKNAAVLEEIGKGRHGLLLRTSGAAEMGIQQYMAFSPTASKMNHYLRTKKKDTKPMSMEERDAEKVTASLSSLPGIPHDIVVRRGVGQGTMAHMLGNGNLSIEEVKRILTENNKNGGGAIVQEKGLCSTSVASMSGFGAEGIEFIILVRKGTKAIDMSNSGSRESEKELLINAGTKFRVLKSFFNDGSEGSERKAFLESKNMNSWKIYLETIPQDGNDGVEA